MSPSEWGATVDYDTKSWTPWVPDKLVVHWGGSAVRSDAADGVPSEEEAQLRSWGSFHINTQGWLGIAYNWAIGNSGTLYRLRGENRSAATSGDEEPDGIPENQEAIAVVFMIGLGQLASSLPSIRSDSSTPNEVSQRESIGSSGTRTAVPRPVPEISCPIGLPQAATPKRRRE